jgi:uncharacterized protein
MERNVIIPPANPWYRHPWPWILMTGPALAVAAGFVTMYIAFTHADPLVVDQYYKEGLAINRVLERDHAAMARGYRATIVLNEKDRTLVRVHMAGDRLPAELRLHFIHPTRSGLDREFFVRQIQPGWYEGSALLPKAPRWNVELEDAQRQWRLTGAWDPSEDQFVLEPRS